MPRKCERTWPTWRAVCDGRCQGMRLELQAAGAWRAWVPRKGVWTLSCRHWTNNERFTMGKDQICKIKCAFYKGYSGQDCGEGTSCSKTETRKPRGDSTSRMTLPQGTSCVLTKRRLIFFPHNEKYGGRWQWSELEVLRFSLPFP